MEENLIDSEFNETPKDVILGIIRWWEKKRLLFNLIIIGIVLLAVVPNVNAESISAGDIISFVIQSILYFLFINACYSVGWGFHLLLYYYFNKIDRSNALDYTLFSLGTIFTCIVTYLGYADYMRYG